MATDSTIRSGRETIKRCLYRVVDDALLFTGYCRPSRLIRVLLSSPVLSILVGITQFAGVGTATCKILFIYNWCVKFTTNLWTVSLAATATVARNGAVGDDQPEKVRQPRTTARGWGEGVCVLCQQGVRLSRRPCVWDVCTSRYILCCQGTDTPAGTVIS